MCTIEVYLYNGRLDLLNNSCVDLINMFWVCKDYFSYSGIYLRNKTCCIKKWAKLSQQYKIIEIANMLLGTLKHKCARNINLSPKLMLNQGHIIESRVILWYEYNLISNYTNYTNVTTVF